MKFNNQFCDPPFDKWPAILQSNIKPEKANKSLRDKLILKARNFTESLAGVPALNIDWSAGNIVMSGHQPEIYHHGILYKNYLLEEFCRVNKVIGINLIIDIDEGYPGTITYPTQIDKVPGKKKLNFPGQLKPYMFLNYPSEDELNKVFDELSKHVDISKYRKHFILNAGRPVAEANTAIRRIYQEARCYLDVTLSSILNFNEVQNVFKQIIQDSRSFANTYNSILNDYRLKENIKNKANPFPDLRIDDNLIELPFWIIDVKNSSREPLLVGNSAEVISKMDSAEYILAPKAALITTLARLFLSDLFIHGLGGSKYDKFTDLLIESYFKVQPPKYVTASADRYYFENEISSYEQAKARFEERRKQAFHIDKYIEGLDCPQDIKNKLLELVKIKSENIEKIKQGKQARVSTALFTQEIKRVEAEIKVIINTILGPEPQFTEPAKVYLETIYSRDFSFLIF